MNIQNRKLNIIRWVTKIDDESILEKIEQLKPFTDWWDTISEEEKEEIEEGLSQADNNELKSTNEVLDKYRK